MSLGQIQNAVRVLLSSKLTGRRRFLRRNRRGTSVLAISHGPVETLEDRLLLTSVSGMVGFDFAPESWKTDSARIREAMMAPVNLGVARESAVSDSLQALDYIVADAGLPSDLPDWLSSSFQIDADGRVAVRVAASNQTNVIDALGEVGFTVSQAMPQLGFLEGWIPVTEVSRLADLAVEGLRGFLPIIPPINDAGTVESEADTVLETARARLAGSIDGSGVTIGVLSNSYDKLGGAATGVANGDLPVVNVVHESTATSNTDEGRAMIELIHDIAPGASIAFATGNGGEATFAQNIRDLADPSKGNASIIVDDIVYLAEPFFQDGLVAQAINSVFADGVTYFSSAGNRADGAWETTSVSFVNDTITGIGSGSFLDFDTSGGVDIRQQITIPNGDRFRPSLQWDDPWYTVAGVDADIDLYLLDSSNTVVASSVIWNITNQVPYELTSTFTNSSGSTQNYNLVIQLYSGTAPSRLKYVDFGGDEDTVTIEYDTNSPTVNPHAAAAGAAAVAASRYYQQNTAEYFTSQGPSTILFDSDGTRKGSPEVRQTPNFAASDGTSTSVTGFTSFFGTSAAAPNAAAVAALVKQQNSTFSPSQIVSRLADTANDFGAAGYDNVVGSGLVDGFNAVFGGISTSGLGVSDGFESSFLDASWETNSTAAGRVQVTSDNGPDAGTYQLTMDSIRNGYSSRNEAILHVDMTGFGSVNLSFRMREFGDESDTMPSTFTGSSNSDGVALSVDGTNWFRVTDLTGANIGETFQTYNVDISAVAAANSLTLGSDVRIKFQQYDNFGIDSATSPTNSDGFAFDAISITATPTAMFGISLAGGVAISEKGTPSQQNDTFSVVLGQQPTNDVVLDVTSNDAGEFTVSSAQLTFTNVNWNVSQIVTVTGVNDNVADGNQSVNATVAVNPALSDDAFDTAPAQTVAVTIRDVPLTPTVTGPTGGGNSSRPTITYSDVANETTYALWLIDKTTSTLAYHRLDIPANTTSFQIPTGSELPNGAYRFWLTASNADGFAQWSGPHDFFVGSEITTPAKPVITGTSDSGQGAARPQIDWNAVSGATSYNVYLINLGTGALIASDKGIATNSFTPASALADGRYRIWVNARNVAGTSPWSNPFNFFVGSEVTTPAKPVITGTSDSGQGAARPQIDWNAVSGATSYNVYLINLGTGALIASDKGIATNSFTPASALADGRYRIWVNARNVAGTSPWSNPFDFSIGGAATEIPGIPSGFSAINTNTGTPTIQWNAGPNASSWAIWFINRDTGTLISKANNLVTNSFTPASAIPDGNYRIWVRAVNPVGSSRWSSLFDFAVSTALTASMAVRSSGRGPDPATMESTAGISTGQARQILKAAVERYIDAGIFGEQLEMLRSARLVVKDLPGWMIGQARGGVVFLDINAAGFGWFVDQTPMDDVEFRNHADGRLSSAEVSAAGKMDVLSVMLHELGHVLNLEDGFSNVDSNHLMNAWLDPGTRRSLTYTGGSDGATDGGSDGGIELAIPQLVLNGAGNDRIKRGQGDDLLIGGDMDNDGDDPLALDDLDATFAAWATGDLQDALILGSPLDNGDKNDLKGEKEAHPVLLSGVSWNRMRTNFQKWLRQTPFARA